MHTAGEKQGFGEVGRNKGPELVAIPAGPRRAHLASPQLSCNTLQTKFHFLSFLEVSEPEHISVSSHSHFSKILPDVFYA